MRLQKLSKAQIKKSLEQTPAHVILSGKRRLTHKQKTFAKNLVEGMNQTEAYAQAYQHKGKRKTMSDNASRLANDSRIQAEVDALERAKEFNALYSSAQLRTLVISQLTKEAVDPTSKASERISALAKLGQVAELGVFVAVSEQRIVKDSASARTELMEQLKKAMSDNLRTIDSDDDADAQALLNMISNSQRKEVSGLANPPVPDPDSDKIGGSLLLHSNVDKRISEEDKRNISETEKTSFQASQEGQLATLPDRIENEEGVGVQKSHPDWDELDTETPPVTVSEQKG
jgi:phage terminase small subunit